MTSSSILSDEGRDALFVEDDYHIHPVEEDEQQLSWRLDPERSHSDWTILVRRTHSFASSGDHDVSTFHVHKNILGVGPWKSDYFAALFRSTTQCSEQSSSTSTIELDELAADCMPLLLDFVYLHEIELSTDLIVALRYLSKYFGVKILYKEVMEYLKQDLSLSNLSVYVSHARLLGDETVLTLAASQCVDCLTDMNQDDLLQAVDPPFLLRIISNPDVDTCSDSYLLSLIVAKYCTIHRTELDRETFLQLTDRKYTPLIDKAAAMPLLEIDALLRKHGDSVEEADVTALEVKLAEHGCDSPQSDVISCLQKRCIHRLALSWADFADPSQLHVLQKVSPSVLANLLQQSCSVSKEAHDKMSEDWRKDVLKLRMDQENIVCGAIEAEIDLKHAAERNQRESQEKISHVRSLLAERERQIRLLQCEWDKMVRVPAEHSFHDESLHTYHHMSGNEPFDHQRNVNRFGRVRPTNMPKIGSSSENGVLVVEQEGNNAYKRWPVFYYKGD